MASVQNAGAPEIMAEESTTQKYIHVSGAKSAPTSQVSNGTTAESEKKGPKPLMHHILLCSSLIFGLSWLAPVIFLFYVNIRGVSIGATAWCAHGFLGCQVLSYWDAGDAAAYSQNAQNDIDNHNLLGALQFIAKALEVWYFFIASSLVWYVTVMLAQSSNGIPIGYFLAHMEFGDILALKDGQLYSTAQAQYSEHRAKALKIFDLRHRLFYFVVFVVFMCITANFMGPSIAVLLVPTLSWSDSPLQNFDSQFIGYLSDQVPSGDFAIPGCNSSQLENQEYDCASYFYETALSALIESMSQEDDQSYNVLGVPDSNMTYYPSDTVRPIEQSIPFTFNFTTTKTVLGDMEMLWALSRQTIRDLSTDFQGLYNTILGVATDQAILDRFAPYNSSFDMVLQRSGPVIGMSFFYYPFGYVNVTELGDSQSIRCYSGASDSPTGAKCMRVGTGWNSSNTVVEFNLGTQNETGRPPIKVMAYWADKAIYTDNQPGDKCLPGGAFSNPSGECDYEQLFTNTTAGLKPGDLAHDMFVVEYSIPSNDSSLVAVAQYFPSYGISTYNIDVTQIYPSLPAATVPDPPAPADMLPLIVHPAWLLAAWNVGPNGSVADIEDSGYYMQLVVSDILIADDDSFNDSVYRFKWYNSYAFAQAASLAQYNTSTLSQDQLNDPNSLPDNQPALWSAVQNQVWGWSISSHTAKVGLTFCSLGILVTLIRSILLMHLWIPGSSSLDLLTSAMRHRYQGELSAEEESDRARVHYKIKPAGDEEGGYTYEHVPNM